MLRQRFGVGRAVREQTEAGRKVVFASRRCETAIALVLAALYPASALADQTFAVVGDYGSTNSPVGTQSNAQGVASSLIGANPGFVLSLGDQLYGPAGTSPRQTPIPVTDTTGGYLSSVGTLYNKYILPNPTLSTSYGTNAGIAAAMKFFPVLGDHDWWTDQTQVQVGTFNKSTGVVTIFNTPVPVNTAGVSTPASIALSQSYIDANPAFYAAAAQALAAAATTYPLASATLAQSSIGSSLVVYGSPNATKNGDSYETFFSGLYNMPSSKTPSGSARWYDTVQDKVQVFTLSSDPNELGQGGLKSINLQDPNAAAKNLAGTQGQWFQTALAASTAKWNIVQMHNPVLSGSAPEEEGGSGGHNSAAYMQWFDNTKVDLVLSGHVHGYERLYNNGIPYIVNGVGGTWEGFATFCNQSGAPAACQAQFNVSSAFAGSGGSTFVNGLAPDASVRSVLSLTQMQIGNTYGYQLITINDASNYLRSRFFGYVTTDPNDQQLSKPGSWQILDDFFIVKNGVLNAAEAGSATGLHLKMPDGAATGFGTINTENKSVTLNALITGPGQLVVTGGGRLTLGQPQLTLGAAPAEGHKEQWQYVSPEAANSYSGGTYVTGSTTLIIANDSLLGAASGALTLDGGTLQVSAGVTSARSVILGSGNGTIDTNSSAVTLSGVVSGTGGLIKAGAGTLTLTGANTYTGNTAIQQGTLQVGSGGTTGSILGNVGNNGNLAFNLSSNTTLSGVISGTGALRNDGTGTLTLTGTNAYTGATTVNSGKLLVNGSIASSSAVNVENGATLGGSGTVSTTTVKNGATLSPGNSIGTLSVSGNLTFNAGSGYAVELGKGVADNAAVTGTAALAGALNATAVGLSYQPQTLTIVSATGGVSGTFTGLANNAKATLGGALGSQVLNPRILYGATTVSILSDGAAPGALSAILPNTANATQQGVAQGIGNAAAAGNTPSAPFSALLNMSGGQLNNALTQISGPAMTGGTQAGTQLMNSFLSLVLNPFGGAPGGNPGALGFARSFGAAGDVPPEVANAYAAVTPRDVAGSNMVSQRWGVWGQAYGGLNKTGGDANVGTADTTSRTYGFAIGADYKIAPGAMAGFALAAGNTNWGLGGGLGGGKSDVFQMAVYGSKQFGAAYVSGALSYAWHDTTTDRYVTVAGTDHLQGGFDANSLGGRLESGYRFAMPQVSITPYAAAQVQAFRTPSYGETAVSGSNAFALSYSARTTTATRTELGAWFDKVIALDKGHALALRARTAWAHDHAGNGSVTALFQTLPGSSFTVNGAAPPPNLALLSAGAELRLASNWSLGAKFDGEFSSRSQTYAGTGTVRYMW